MTVDPKSNARRTAILVVGMHRSGTSAITRTLNLMGAAVPANLLQPSPTENPAGFWESADIVASHDRFLAAVGSRWDDPVPLPESAFTGDAARACHDQLVGILRRDLAKTRLSVIKDPRLCRLLPLWRSVLATFGAQPVAVVPVRNPSAVAMSLHRRNGFQREKSLALWLIHALLAERATRGWPRVFVNYDSFIESPAEAASALASRLGCFIPDEVLAALATTQEFWHRGLRHHGPEDGAPLPAWVRDVHGWLAAAAGGAEPTVQTLDAVAAALMPALEVYGPLVGHDPGLESVLRVKCEELDRLQRQTAHLKETMAAASAECVGLKEANTTLERAKANLEGANGALTENSARLTAEIATLRADLEGAAAERAHLKGAYGALEQERMRLVADHAELATALDGVSAERDGLLATNSALQEHRSRLTAENAALLAKLEATSAETLRRQDETAMAQSQAERERAALADEIERLHARLGALGELERAIRALSADVERERTMRQASSRRCRLSRLPTRFRRLIEAAMILPYLRGPMFDVGYYRAAHPAAPAWLPLRLHYALVGRLREASPNRLFDPSYYRARNADVAASGADPFLHYIRHGGHEGRKPSPAFDGAYYLRQNPDVARRRVNPLRHYLAYGWREGRDPNPFFDTSSYLAEDGAFGEPLAHYLDRGAGEGRQPSAQFDAARYLHDNPDVAATGLNPLIHYLEFGIPEGRARPKGGMLAIRQGDDGPRILMVLHGLGGGVERHCSDMERLLEAEGVTVWRLESLAEGTYRLGNRALGVECTYLGNEETKLLEDIRRLRPNLVHVHHFIGYGQRLMHWLHELSLPYDVTVHDYALYCPRVTLLDGNYRYCGEPQDAAACGRCIAMAGAHTNLQSAFDCTGNVQVWREKSASLLTGARNIYVPDQDVADRLKQHFPMIATMVRPHPEPRAVIPTRPPVGGGRVRIAIIGSIGPHKGFKVLKACAEAAQRKKLPLTFIVIGEVCAAEKLAVLGNVEVMGRYREDDLPQRIEEARCHAAAFLSVWPETYMYTLSAALRAGLYPVVFDLGAPARRLKELGWGAVLSPTLDASEINRRLLEFGLNHPTPPAGLTIGCEYASVSSCYLGLQAQ